MLLLLLVLILLFGCGGGWVGNRQYGPTGGFGIGLGTILIILLLFWLLTGFGGIHIR